MKVVAEHPAGAMVFCEIRARTRQAALPANGVAPTTALLEKLESIERAGNRALGQAFLDFLRAYAGRERKLPSFGVNSPAGVRRAQDMLEWISDAEALLEVVADRHPLGSATFHAWRELVQEPGEPFSLATNADLLERLCTDDPAEQAGVQAATNFLNDYVGAASLLQSWSGERLPAAARDAQEMLKLIVEWEQTDH